MNVLVKGIDLPKCCDDCFALDDSGDYPFCLITQEQRGYNFCTREKRMDECPLVEVEMLHDKVIKDKYDCSKTLDYVHERKRMCDYFVDQKGIRLCDKCPLQGLPCSHVCEVTPAHIDGVQTWSDTHPEKTRKEAFLEMFPKADTRLIGVNKACFGYLIGEKCGDARCGEVGCEGCWDRPYNGEFEKARENKND